VQLDMSKPEDQRTWALLGPTYQDAVDSALNDLHAAQDTQVQDMLATLAQSSKNQTGQLFTDAKAQFDAIRYQSVLNPGNTYHPVSAFRQLERRAPLMNGQHHQPLENEREF
jgi:hypothetical protein